MTTDEPMVRAAISTDRQAVVALAASSGLFPPEAAEEVAATFDSSLNGDDPDAVWSVITTGVDVVGVSYLGPEQMANGTWNLHFLAVDSGRRGSGPGGHLVAAAELVVRERGGRVLLIEPRVRMGSTVSGPSTRGWVTPSKPASATSTITGTTRSCFGRPS